MKKELIKKLVLELENEGFNIDGFLCEEGVMGGNYGLIEFEFFDDVNDNEIKDYLKDYLGELEDISYI
jgi:nucleoside-triphosphatase THEP1